MIKQIVFIICYFYINYCSANPEIIINNKTTSSITINYNFMQDNENLIIESIRILPKGIFYATTKKYSINKNYLLKIEDTHIPCAWINTLGVAFAHGWGIKLTVNLKHTVTICSNKYSVIDYTNHAELIYVRNSEGQEKFIFQNQGWWPQDNVFPTKQEITLNNLKQNLTDHEVNLFIYSGLSNAIDFQLQYLKSLKKF